MNRRTILRTAVGTLAAAYRNQSDQDALAAYVIRQLHAAWAMGV